MRRRDAAFIQEGRGDNQTQMNYKNDNYQRQETLDRKTGDKHPTESNGPCQHEILHFITVTNVM